MFGYLAGIVQCFAELGIFGIACFGGILYVTTSQIRRVNRVLNANPQLHSLKLQVFALETSILIFLVGGLTVSRFYWIKRRTSGRPAFVLAHRLEQHRSDYSVAAEVQFYVGHSFNSMLTLIACVPMETGTLVLSINRLFTDQVTGFGSGLKKKIGRGQVVEAMEQNFEELLVELEKPGQTGGP